MKDIENKSILGACLDLYLLPPQDGPTAHPDCHPSIERVASEIYARRAGAIRESGKCSFCGNPLSARLSVCESASEKYDDAAILIEARKTYPGITWDELQTKSREWEKSVGQFAPKPETVLDKLPPKARQKLRALDDWSPEHGTSLIFYGDTRTGKTRAMFEILKREWDRKTHPTFYTATALARAINQSFEDRNHSRLIDRLIRCPLLALDDVGKERMTSRMQTDLFEIIDARTAAGRPTIMTTNFTGDSIHTRLEDSDTRAPLVARLREFFRSINF